MSTLRSGMDAVSSASGKSSKKSNRKLAEPSKQTIENILNFSKALRIEPKADGKGFIEYLAN